MAFVSLVGDQVAGLQDRFHLLASSLPSVERGPEEVAVATFASRSRGPRTAACVPLPSPGHPEYNVHAYLQ